MCQKRILLLQELRNHLIAKNFQGLIVPSSDPHKSEYLADHWKLREWLSGFTGSAGILVVTQSSAEFITDFRYKDQAGKQVKGAKVNMHSGGDYIKAVADSPKLNTINTKTAPHLILSHIILKRSSKWDPDVYWIDRIAGCCVSSGI